MARVVVQKDRRMIADEIGLALKGPEWERDLFRRLTRPTLVALARQHIPGWKPELTLE